MQWLTEGTAVYLAPDIGGSQRSFVVGRVRDNNLPRLSSLEARNFYEIFGATDEWENYQWAGTMVEFIDKTLGFDTVVELHRNPADFTKIIGMTRTQFEQQWHLFLRDNYK